MGSRELSRKGEVMKDEDEILELDDMSNASMDNTFPLDSESLNLPNFTEELWTYCRKHNDFMPILFEVYKHIGGVCAYFTYMSRSSPAVKEMPALHYAVLVGLLNRCIKLMLSVLHLASNKKFGDTIGLLSRSIFESSVIIQWLCKMDDDESFSRYLADGLKTDLKLKDHINENNSKREGKILVIEKDMLDSIQDYIESTDMSEKAIRDMRALPNLANMCDDIELPKSFYIGIQRMGSHSVHGTWTAIRGFSLKQDEDGEYYPRGNDVRPHENQFMITPLIILATLRCFLEYVIPDKVDREEFEDKLNENEAFIISLNSEITTSDFQVDYD